jgi:protein pelota
MQILKLDEKEGRMRLRPESLDDLWHLDKVLEPGDLVTAKTLRRTAIKRGQEVREGDKAPVMLTIRLEKKEFHKDTRSLRLAGRIVAGPEDRVQLGSYHTIAVGVRDSLSVTKQWKPFQVERLRKARVSKPLLLVCVLDREQADFAELRESGIVHLASIRSRKAASGEIEGYHEEILGYLQSREQGFQVILVAGPGFERENLLRFVRERNPGLAGRMVLEHTAGTGRAGISEVVRASANRVLRETRIAREAGLVERLLTEIQKDGLAVYGREETRKAVEAGAVEVLLVSEERMAGMEDVMRAADGMGARIAIIAADHEAGERFLGLGGIGGLLRFRV